MKNQEANTSSGSVKTGEPETEMRYSFEEYELYYKTTEKVTDWRIDVNKWNYSVCITILAAIGIIINWGVKYPEFVIYSIIFPVILSIIGILFCKLWRKQIVDYKNLNAAKFEVLNKMAKSAYSSNLANVMVRDPFYEEWDILKSKSSTVKAKGLLNEALTSSLSELMVPRFFILLFSIIIFSTSVFSIVNYDVVFSKNILSIQAIQQKNKINKP